MKTRKQLQEDRRVLKERGYRRSCDERKCPNCEFGKEVVRWDKKKGGRSMAYCYYLLPRVSTGIHMVCDEFILDRRLL